MQFPAPDRLATGVGRVAAAVELHRSLNSTLGERKQPATALPAAFPDVELPAPQEPTTSWVEVDRRRRSEYRSGKQVPAPSQLSTVLGSLDTAPSAGGLHSTSAYVALLAEDVETRPDSTAAGQATSCNERTSVQSVAQGVYRYESQQLGRSGQVEESRRVVRRLAAHCAVDAHEFSKTLVQPEFSTVFPVIVILVANTQMVFDKYALKNYQMVFADSGVLIQSMYLACAALDIPCCAIGGVDSTAMQAYLSLPASQLVTMAFAVGTRTA